MNSSSDRFHMGRLGWLAAAFLLCITWCSTNAVAVKADDSEVPDWLQQRMSFRTSQRRDNGDMITLVKPLAQKTAPSVVQVVVGDKPVGLGIVVSNEGHVLTKRSELSSDPIRLRVADGRLLPARVAAVRRKSDLALLTVDSEDAKSLMPLQFTDQKPEVGSFLVSAGRGGIPVGIGVMSVDIRRIESNGRLGVILADNQGQVTVERVWEKSGADAAGVAPGDRILAINGRSETGRAAVMRLLRDMFPGESVRLTILRDGNKMDLNAVIGDFGVMQESDSDTKINGRRSQRISGFEQVIQHDTVLDPDQCGGPLLDLKGNVVGMNIARAGRVVSYALPSSLVMPELASMLNEVRAAQTSP